MKKIANKRKVINKHVAKNDYYWKKCGNGKQIVVTRGLEQKKSIFYIKEINMVQRYTLRTLNVY